MPSVGKECDACGRYYRAMGETAVICPHCQNEKAEISLSTWDFSVCPFCQGRQFYRRKDFNQILGCLVVLVGVVLVPFTYGISLPVLILADWILYRRVSDLVVCYRCQAEFREFGVIPEEVRTFDHHTAELYETPKTEVS